MPSSASCKLGARREATFRRLGRIALFAAALAVPSLAARPQRANAESIKIQISNFPTWKEVQGVAGVVSPSYSGERLSVLERMQILSQPYVRIENNSSDPLVGFQMDMSNWNAKISSVDWIYKPVDGVTPSWNWNEAAQSAFFQFGANPLTFGQAVVMRLGTAAKPGQIAKYNADQTLFSPSNLTCYSNNTGGVCFNMFVNRNDKPYHYDTAGKPQGAGIIETEACTENLQIGITKIKDPAGITLDAVVPVPEPSTVVLAASAAAATALSCLRHRRRRSVDGISREGGSPARIRRSEWA